MRMPLNLTRMRSDFVLKTTQNKRLKSLNQNNGMNECKANENKKQKQYFCSKLLNKSPPFFPAAIMLLMAITLTELRMGTWHKMRACKRVSQLQRNNLKSPLL